MRNPQDFRQWRGYLRVDQQKQKKCHKQVLKNYWMQVFTLVT
jgi:hypothetical protein